MRPATGSVGHRCGGRSTQLPAPLCALAVRSRIMPMGGNMQSAGPWLRCVRVCECSGKCRFGHADFLHRHAITHARNKHRADRTFPTQAAYRSGASLCPCVAPLCSPRLLRAAWGLRWQGLVNGRGAAGCCRRIGRPCGLSFACVAQTRRLRHVTRSRRDWHSECRHHGSRAACWHSRCRVARPLAQHPRRAAPMPLPVGGGGGAAAGASNLVKQEASAKKISAVGVGWAAGAHVGR